MTKAGVTSAIAALVLAGAAAASSGGNMAAAMRALHYPKAGAVKLTCRRAGAGFACKATYRHRKVRRFYAAWQATGGWVCAGAKPATCKTLRHGFIVGAPTDLRGAAEQTAIGYMALKYQAPQPFVDPNCTQPTTQNSWSFCYKLDTGSVNVTVHLAKAKGGYVTTTTAALY